MSFNIETYRQNLLDSVELEVGADASPTAKGNAFCRWCLENVFDQSSDQALDAMDVSGAFDHGIDAFVKDDEQILVIQSKYESAHNWSEIAKFHYDMERIRQGKVQSNELNERVEPFIAEIQDAYVKAWKVTFYYLTSKPFTPTEKSKLQRLDGNETDFVFYDIERIAQKLENKLQEIPDVVRNKFFTLKLASREILKFADKTAVIAVSLADMRDFVSQGGNELFASNVRQYLRGTKINTGIRKTIQERPEKFWLYNNGITIVCDDFEEVNFSLKIKTPQIVNGCQTAKSIDDILSKKREEDRRSLPGHVLVRIIKGANDEEKENITRYTNLQNAVRGKDFFSLYEFHKKLQKRLKLFGYYYEIQRGAFTSLKPSDKNKYGGTPGFSYLVRDRFNNVVPALEAIQAFAAGFKALPGIAMARPNELTPTGPYYDTIFNDDLEPEPKLFLYPYLIREWARNNGYSRGGGGWHAYSAWFFVHAYYVLALQILKQKGFIDPLEESPENIPIPTWDKIFYSQRLNTMLLIAADDMLERYFSDSKVDETVGQDVRKFLRSQDQLDKYRPILVRYADTLASSSRNRKLVEEFATVLNSDEEGSP
ncbi:MAG: AIPR family protein [Aggregatilineales bacterium]